mgnify:CR=1 FL=1
MPETFREATFDDANLIATVRVRTWQAAYRGIFPQSHLDAMNIEAQTERTGNWLRNPERRGSDWVLLNDNEAVGWSVTLLRSRDDDLPADTGEIPAIYVLPAYWGQGYGHRLMAHTLDALRTLGAHSVALWVLEDNLRARAFYVREGFAPDGKRKPETIVPNTNLFGLRYRRTL